MPQHNKGDRPLVGARVPRPYSTKLDRYVEIVGLTKSDYVAGLIMADLDQIDLDNLEQHQEPLPLSA